MNNQTPLPKRLATVFFALSIGLGFTLAPSAFASGSYPGGATGLSGTSSAAAYHLGKAIYTGKLKLPAQVQDLAEKDASVQKKYFSKVETLLPKSAATDGMKVSALAGRMTEQQAIALAYYLKIRYRIALPEVENE